MRLNSITISGFKSFPNRTKLVFSRGVSAIVGPNGCGKSNVVDAIRWVLGEQSPSMLRAKAMENLIFSGTKDRPVNFAEVTLMLEDAGVVNIPGLEDASVIEVTRRLSRNGESECRINGRAARLKDIQYLFMDTGAGARAYAIVDQGKIGTFVDMTADDRRFLLEEAAGISKYKARRVEAESKLAQTRQNLERLEDLMSEVERQMKAIGKQAKKTQTYLGLRDLQDTLEKAVLAHEWKENSGKLHNIEKVHEELTARFAVLRAQTAAMNAAKDTREIEMLDMEKAMETLRRGAADAGERLNSLRETLSSREKGVISGENRLKDAQRTLSDISSREDGVRRRIDDLKTEIGSLEATAKDLLLKLTAGEQGMNEITLARDMLKNALEEVNVELVDAASMCAKFDSQRKTCGSQIERLKIRIKALLKEKDEIGRDSSKKDAEINNLEMAIERLAAGIRETEAGIAAAETERSALEQDLAAIRDRKQGLQSKLATCMARLDALRSIEDSMEGYGAATKALISSHKTFFALADLLDVKTGFESIVESALGHLIQAVVMENMEGFDDIEAFVREQQTGDLHVILPVAGTQALRKGDAGQEIVTARPPADGFIKNIASGLRIMPDLKTALYAFERDVENGDASSCIYITQMGDIIHARGSWGEVIIRGGREGGAGILSRRAELSRLSLEKDALEAELKGLESEETGMKAGLSSAGERFCALMKDKKRMSEEIAIKNGALERIKTRLESQRERILRLDMEKDQADSELMEMEIEFETAQTALEGAEKARKGAEARIREREDALKQQELALSRRRKSLEEVKIAIAGVRTRLDGKKQELLGMEQRLNRMQNEKKTALQIKNEMTSALDILRQGLNEAALKVDAQEEAVKKANVRLNEMRGLYDKKRQEIAGIEAAIKDSGIQAASLQDAIHQNELEMSAITQAMLFIKKAALDKYRADIEKAYESWLPDTFLPDEARDEIIRISKKIDAIGPVNLTALDEYREFEERHSYLAAQKEDLIKSVKDMEQAIRHIDKVSKERLMETIDAVNNGLSEVFPLLFEGGEARLEPTEEGNILDAGLELTVHIPGKRIQHLNLLSGGEKALAALSLIFALFLIKPSPFCLMDEVDAPLDEANTLRFCQLIKKIASMSQMVLVTHNQRVMEHADALYGVTMEENGVSKIVSVELTGRG
jgi:chromosome segregation protein